MTDRGMTAVAKIAANHPSLKKLYVFGEACTVCMKGVFGCVC